MNKLIVYLLRSFKMNLSKLSREEIAKLQNEKYNMEQLLNYVEKLENAHKLINKILHKSNTDKNWYEAQKISDKLMEHI